MGYYSHAAGSGLGCWRVDRIWQWVQQVTLQEYAIKVERVNVQDEDMPRSAAVWTRVW
jgi:hypothetical protein